ncbi:MAG: carboxypeptidase-like regulatory domain-containing protein [archaeon]|nr:carboxypeptidase-like regulatory domain-containing protein [archaeon]
MSYSIVHHIFFLLVALFFFVECQPADASSEDNSQVSDTQICGGFLEFKAASGTLRKLLDYSKITVQTFTLDMVLKETTTLAASGYYFLPVYEDESFILKIKGPYGMAFDPEQYVYNKENGIGLKTFCSKDINFKFQGFYVSGKISTFGSNEGPKGIKLILKDDKEILQKTTTMDQGFFKFQPVYPSEGFFSISPLENKEMFDTKFNEYKFKIDLKKDNYFEKALIIKGYKLSGSIKTDSGMPMENIHVAIYSTNSTLIKDYSCKHKFMNHKDFIFKKIKPFCIINSNSKGEFSFVNIPFGKFIIVPSFRNDYVSYGLEPSSFEVNIQHENYEIKNPFIVKKFKLFGKVLDSKGKGIKDVIIKLDGQIKAQTDSKGIYILDNILEGNYDLEAQADDMFFEPLTNIKLHSLMNNIPDIIVTYYKLCGKILIEATDYFTISKRTVVLKDKGSKERKTITDQGGKFCFEVKPGNYQIYPILTQEEKNSDLHLQPEIHDINVIDKPILNVFFYQSKVKVTGRIKCLNECESNIKIKLISGKNDKILTANLGKDYSFEFINILSGQYKLSIIKPEWCWDKEDINIKVQNEDINDIIFNQIGYSLFYNTQHSLDLIYMKETKKGNKTQTKEVRLNLEKHKEKSCLPNKGEYIFYPESCYIFKENNFTYNTENSSLLEFTPIEYRTKGIMTMDNSVAEILLNPRDYVSSPEIVINLNIEELDSENMIKRNTYKNKTILLKKKNATFEFYTKPNTKYYITPSIKSKNKKFKTILFIPKEKLITVKEECNEDINDLSFSIKNGMIIEGKVDPPMEGIKISAFNKNDNTLLTYSFTNKEGKYTIGPMPNEDKYDLKAEKEGYKIILSGNKFDFVAEKLSFLKVKVIDTENKPLSGVFLSLSSADRSFKMNNNTNNEGYFNFIDLSKGDYYIQPFFKEYEFSNYQKVVTIKGGEHYNITLVAKRVAFSIFGKVNNLNKNKVEGLYIQAINTKTKQIQETAIDKKGEYRLKGLIPNNDYEIKVKIPTQSNIEKALPVFIPIHVPKEDTFGMDFVVLQRSNTVDIRTYLKFLGEDNCPLDKIRNYLVELRKGDEEESKAISTIGINGACQFAFRSLEKMKYLITIIEKGNQKKILENIIDLSDEREINNGVKILHFDIDTNKKTQKENLNYTFYSPLLLFIVIISMLKWDYTVWIIKTFLIGPIGGIIGGMNKSNENSNRGNYGGHSGKKGNRK